MSRSPVARNRDQESLFRSAVSGSTPCWRARLQDVPSANAPAASVGPSVPSVPAASRAAPETPRQRSGRDQGELLAPSPAPVSGHPEGQLSSREERARRRVRTKDGQAAREPPGGFVDLAREVPAEDLGAVAEPGRFGPRPRGGNESCWPRCGGEPPRRARRASPRPPRRPRRGKRWITASGTRSTRPNFSSTPSASPKVVGSPVAGPEPMEVNWSPITSEITSAAARPGGSRGMRPPPLTAERCLRTVLISVDVGTAGEQQGTDPRLVLQGDARRRRHQQRRRSPGQQHEDPAAPAGVPQVREQPPRRLHRVGVGDGMSRLLDHHPGNLEPVTVLHDDPPAHGLPGERAPDPPGECGGRLAGAEQEDRFPPRPRGRKQGTAPEGPSGRRIPLEVPLQDPFRIGGPERRPVNGQEVRAQPIGRRRRSARSLHFSWGQWTENGAGARSRAVRVAR